MAGPTQGTMLSTACLLLACLVGPAAVASPGGFGGQRHTDPSRLREVDLPAHLQRSVDASAGDKPPTRIAGYFKLDRATRSGEMFYFFFQARHNPSKAPLVLWMTGGPGCSSELAVVYENGPWTFDKSGNSLVETKYGWDVTHNMIFVDQPIGTGFSYSEDSADTVYGEKGVAEDMLDFFYHFYAAHPELANLPLYITGESYAGHYVPAVSHRVWLANKNKEGPYINFKGLAIGNGITEPAEQYSAYGDFALQAGLISEKTHAWMSFFGPTCRVVTHACQYTGWNWLCSLGDTFCSVTQYQPILQVNPDVNVYNVKLKCLGPLCYDFSAADHFFNSASIRKALSIPDGVTWQMCNPVVFGHFRGEALRRFDTLLPDMLADGIRVLIYAGDLDLICNYLGNRRWVDALDWYGSAEWDDETDFEWSVAGQTAGKVKHWGPLSFVQVYKAGHMVPMDQPLNALAMITAFTRNVSLTTHDTTLDPILDSTFTTDNHQDKTGQRPKTPSLHITATRTHREKIRSTKAAPLRRRLGQL